MEKAPEGLEVALQYFADFTPAQLQQLTALAPLYQEWNAQINVISRKDIDSLYEKHVLHSLAIAAVFSFTADMEVIDIGTGGGFPGIPLAIFFPNTRFHLVDSIGKKIKVVEAIKDSIGLTNVTTQHGRAEEIKDRKFDVAVSRAVAPLKELWTWTRPLLRKSDRTSSKFRALTSPRPGPSQTLGPPNQRGDELRPSTLLRGSFAPSRVDPTEPAHPSGLICLKGGDLAAEISASSHRPRIMEISEIFPLDYFREKYILQILPGATS